MDVDVDDQHALARPLLDQPHRGDGKVVEHAIARAALAQSMVAPARIVQGEASIQRLNCRAPGPARHDARPPRHRPGHGKADPALHSPSAPAAAITSGDIGRRMGRRSSQAARHRLGAIRSFAGAALLELGARTSRYCST
jgi:hypothetical protein